MTTLFTVVLYLKLIIIIYGLYNMFIMLLFDAPVKLWTSNHSVCCVIANFVFFFLEPIFGALSMVTPFFLSMRLPMQSCWLWLCLHGTDFRKVDNEGGGYGGPGQVWDQISAGIIKLIKINKIIFLSKFSPFSPLPSSSLMLKHISLDLLAFRWTTDMGAGAVARDRMRVEEG